MNPPTTKFVADMTLDPPGSIAVIGAGPLGVEAALYGRFLGYDVTLIESESVGHSMSEIADQPLPMLPDRCLSPLALNALKTQSGDTNFVLPVTYGEWIKRCLVPLTETDLLSGRLKAPMQVTGMDLVPVEPDERDEDGNDVPPDFRLALAGEDGVTGEVVCEAVILAIGPISIGSLQIPQPEYLFRIGAGQGQGAEVDLLTGRKEIVAVFATFAGREDLDLYRPLRS